MEDFDPEQEERLQGDRKPRRAANETEEKGCSDKFHETISRYMLPEDLHSDYMEQANCCPPPIFIITISIAELAVFIYYAVWKPHKQWVTLDQSLWRSPLTYDPAQRQEAWRFISYMFIHAGVGHIVGNLSMQLLLGIPLELVHKGFEIGMVYMAGVLAGSLASSIFDPLSALVGASGGVYALIGGYFMNAVVNRKKMIPLFQLFRILLIVLIIGSDFGYALYRRFGTHEGGLQVSFVAHVGGLVAGMSIGYVFFSAYNKELLKDPRFWMCIVGYIIFLIFAVFFNIFISPAPQNWK